jgi:hypothetical protein
MEAMLEISLCIATLNSTSKKCFVFLIIAYVFSSTKFEKRVEQGGEGVGGRGSGWRTGGRNDPNNVCTYEYMTKEKNVKKNKVINSNLQVKKKRFSLTSNLSP